MTTFKVNCGTCGEFQEQAISEIVMVHYGDFELSYRFHCLMCGEKNQEPANPEVRTALAACDVPVIRLNREYDRVMSERERIDREVEKMGLWLATARVEDFVKA